MVRVGLPAAGENFIDMGGFLMFTIFVGTAGAVQLAASQITIQLLSFSFMPLWGLTTAAGVLTGNWIGAGDPDRAAHYGRQVYKLGTYYSLALAVVMLLAAATSCSASSPTTPRSWSWAPAWCVAAAIFQYFDGMRMLSSGILQGAGDTRYTMLVTLVLMWGGFIPLTWYLIVAPRRRRDRRLDRRLRSATWCRAWSCGGGSRRGPGGRPTSSGRRQGRT